MCLFPKLIDNPRYKSNKKNGGVIPPVRDKRHLYISIGCNDCYECRKKKGREWQIRMKEELKKGNKGYFVVLTFSNESIKKLDEKINNKELKGWERDNTIAKLGVRCWLERWRKKHKKSIRHWLITELGHNGTENIHIHGIVWTEKDFEDVRSTWGYGFVYPRKEDMKKNYVGNRSINYIIKYVTKYDEINKGYKQAIMCSAGIGDNFKAKAINKEEDTYINENGIKVDLPIYYKNKIFNDNEKEDNWTKKLDKGERYVMGKKIATNTEKGMLRYLKEVKQAQKLSKRWGYGDGVIDWEEKKYIELKREILRETRIKNAKK